MSNCVVTHKDITVTVDGCLCASDTVCVGDKVTFANLIDYDYTSPYDTLIFYEADAETVINPRTDTTFLAPGEYLFYVQAVFEGCTSKMEYIFIVVMPEVIANFIPSTTTACEGTIVSFENTSTVDGAPSDLSNTLSWKWYLNYPSAPFSTDKDAFATFSQGTHYVTLKVVGKGGCEDRKTRKITIRPKPVVVPKTICD
jgi:plastocyanin